MKLTEFRPDWPLITIWSLATALGGALGWLLGSFANLDQNLFWNTVFVLTATGTMIGLGQWVVLSRYWGDFNAWPLITLLGAGLAAPLAFVFSLRLSESARQIINFAIIGCWMGALQWLILRRRFANAGWWILFSGLGGGLGWAINNFITRPLINLLTPGLVESLFSCGLCLGLGLGLVTGFGLSWLARSDSAEEPLLSAN
jgi:hypothetical protein